MSSMLISGKTNDTTSFNTLDVYDEWKSHNTLLPNVLRRRSDGIIVFRNSRISLHLVLEEFVAGRSLEEIRTTYPTLTMEALQSVLEFYDVERVYCDDYLRGCHEQAERMQQESSQSQFIQRLRDRHREQSGG